MLKVAIVGSREAPVEHLKQMYNLGVLLIKNGCTLRSGAAKGIDNVVTVLRLKYPCAVEIYVPNGRFRPEIQRVVPTINVEHFANRTKAIKLAKSVHPNPKTLVGWALALHGRNPYQILGRDLDDPVDAVLLSAPKIEGGVRGGTNTAYQLAKAYGITTHNLYDGLEPIIDWCNMYGLEYVEDFKKLLL